MATSRIVATNENISTYGVARDYSSLSSWESDTDINLVSAAQSEVLECYDDAADFDDAVNVAGATTNSSYFRIIRAADGEGHDGTPNNGVEFLSSSSADMFELDEDYASVQDLIIGYQVVDANPRVGYATTGADFQSFIGVIVSIADGGLDTGRGISLRGPDSIAVNCLVQDVDSDGFNPRAPAGETVRHYNCTAVNNGERGFDEGGDGDHVCINCLADNNGTEDWDSSGDWVGCSFNASSDGTAPGTSVRLNQTFTFVNAAGDDFHLAFNDGGARNFGTDLSADGNFAFDDDIDFEVRPGETDWDIGFDEFIPSGQPFWKRLGGVPYMRANKGVW